MIRCHYCGKPAVGGHNTCPDHVHRAPKEPQPRPPKWGLPVRTPAGGHTSPSLGRRGPRGR
jgi:hypothetical protein